VANVRFENVTKSFGDTVAIRKLSFDIKDKEFFVLLGPTGAGKTTTLRSFAGLEKIDEGEIYINEAPVSRLTPAQRDVAFVFQYYTLYPHLTVKENLLFPLKAKIWNIAPEERERRIQGVTKTLHIEPLLDRKVGTLSGGEMQRVGIGRAIVRTPKIFLMDEPLSNLDAKLREEMRIELKRLQEELGATFLFVTHDQVEAMSLSDRVAVLEKGKIQQIGTPKGIYGYPDNITVALAVGSPSINLIDAVLENGVLNIGPGFLRIKLAEAFSELAPEVTIPQELILGIRPEDISIHRAEKSEAFKAEVYVIKYMGQENDIELRIDKKIITCKTPADLEIQIGDHLWVAFETKRLLLFDKMTNRRVLP